MRIGKPTRGPEVVRIIQRFRSGTLAAGLLLFGCASQSPPSGGPPDRTPPRVLSSIPSPDSVSVGTDTEIEVLFSEAMDRQSVERAVFVSPTPVREPRLRWKGQRLRIFLEDGLVADRTYRVSIGADGRDENRNKMTGSYDFTFSTGITISRGVVSGKIRGTTGQTVVVAAYDVDETPDPDPGTRAPYVTQSGEHGEYRFPGLGVGRYRVLAIGDRNQDQVLDVATESLGIATQDVHLMTDTSTVVLPDIKLASRDTERARPIAARTVNNRRIRIKMNKPAHLPLNVGIVGKSGALEIESTYLAAEDSSIVFLLTEPQTEGEEYQIRVSGYDTTLVVKGDGRNDRRAPRVVRVTPGTGHSAHAQTSIVLTFSEAMRADAVDRLWVASDSTDSPSGNVFWSSPNALVFEPADPFDESDILLRLNAGALSDAAGNLADEEFDVAFNAISESSLGTVAGGLNPMSVPVVVEVVDLDWDRSLKTLRVSPGDTTFVLRDLLPGRYQIQAYVDSNDDGEWGAGALAPLTFSESLLAPADTVEVRPRWETILETRFRSSSESKSNQGLTH